MPAPAQKPQDGEKNDGKNHRKGWRELIQDRRILTFTGVVVLFNVGNTSTLPLVGQLLSKGRQGAPVWQTAACVIVAEIMMVGVAWAIGKRVDVWGRKPLFITAFAVPAVRNALTNISHAQGYLIGLQSLDRVAAAIYGVLLTLAADPGC